MANDHPYVHSPLSEGRPALNRETSFSTGSHRQSSAPLLQKGQTFQGQVTNITAREITIQLADGRNVTARYENAPDLLIGDTAAFRVLSADEHGITLQTLMQGGNSATKNITILKALEAASLPVTERNVSMVTALLSHNLPIHSQMLNHVLQQSFRNPDISLPNLIAMNQLGLPINPETTQMYENYDNMLHQLLPEMESAIDGLFSTLSDLLNQNSPDAAIRFAARLLSVPENLSFGENAVPKETAANGEINSTRTTDSGAEKAVPGDVSTDNREIIHDRTATGEPFSAEMLIFSDDASDLLPASDSREALTSLLREWSQISLPSDTSTGAPNNVPDNVSDNVPDNVPNNVPSSTELLDALRSLLPADYSPLSMEHMLSGTKEGLKELISHPSFRRFTKELFLRNWTLTPEELFEKDSVRELYKRLSSQTEELSKLLSESEQQSKQSGQSAKDNLAGMRQNLGFMNMLNDLYQYVQLPLRLTKETAHGDLYVYANKKNRQPSDGSFSCLLHLELNRLGALDVRIQLTGKQVNARFFLEDKVSAGLIQSHLPELDKAVSSRGYQFKSEAVFSDKKKEETSLEKKLLGQTESSSDVYRYSFDVRA